MLIVGLFILIGLYSTLLTLAFGESKTTSDHFSKVTSCHKAPLVLMLIITNIMSTTVKDSVISSIFLWRFGGVKAIEYISKNNFI